MFALRHFGLHRRASALLVFGLCALVATAAYADRGGRGRGGGHVRAARSFSRGGRNRGAARAWSNHPQRTSPIRSGVFGHAQARWTGGGRGGFGHGRAQWAQGNRRGGFDHGRAQWAQGNRRDGFGQDRASWDHGRTLGWDRAHHDFFVHNNYKVRFVRPAWYHPPVVRAGFYYYSGIPRLRPCYYGHWAFSFSVGFSTRSCYFYYGYFPYLETSRIVVLPYPVVTYYELPPVDDGYYLEQGTRIGLDDALADIRDAWIDSRYDKIEAHVSSDTKLAVLLDGKYNYSIDAEDYLHMTHDAIEQMHTVSFTWDKVEGRSDGGYTAFGTHVYRDSSGNKKRVYVSYTLQRSDGDYYITEVGSSEHPLI